MNLTEEGTYTFISLTEKDDAGLTYTFNYMDGGEEKEAVLRPSEGGIHLRTLSWEDINGSYLFPSSDKEDADSWKGFSQEGEDWVYLSSFLNHVDAGKYKITINAHECSVPIKIREVKVVKTNEL